VITVWNGVTYADVPGVGRKPLDELTGPEAVLVLARIEALQGRLEADKRTIQALARRKREEATR
jgi:hypothetical protein